MSPLQYDWERLPADVTIAVIDGGMAGIPFGNVAAKASWGRLMFQGIKAGFLTGFTTSALHTALQEQTWQHSTWDGLRQTAWSGLQGGVLGGAVGGVLTGAHLAAPTVGRAIRLVALAGKTFIVEEVPALWNGTQRTLRRVLGEATEGLKSAWGRAQAALTHEAAVAEMMAELRAVLPGATDDELRTMAIRGLLAEVTDAEVLAAIKGVPTHYADTNRTVSDLAAHLAGSRVRGGSVRAHYTYAKVLAKAEVIAANNENAQIQRIAQHLGRSESEVRQLLETALDQAQFRLTHSADVGINLLHQLEAGETPRLLNVFESNRTSWTTDPIQVARTQVQEAANQARVFGTDVYNTPLALRPKYGYVVFPDAPSQPHPYGAVEFHLNTANADLRARTTLLPVDSFSAHSHELGTLAHPGNALARSEYALRASGLLTDEVSQGLVGSGVRPIGSGLFEFQTWGQLPITPEFVSAIRLHPLSPDAPASHVQGIANIRELARRQGIPIIE